MKSLSTAKKALYYKATHRGVRENDLLMTSFVNTYLNGLDETQLAHFSELLNENDQDILAWVMEQKVTPSHYKGIINKLRSCAHFG